MTQTTSKIPLKPKGFGAITAAISVADLSAAITYYTETMAAETVETLTVPDSQEIVHAQLKIGGTVLILSLDKSALPYAGVGHVTLLHYVGDIEAAFDRAVTAGAVVVAPVATSWWGERNATLVDPFGVRWGLAQRVEVLSAADRKARFQDLYSTPASDRVPEGSEADTPTGNPEIVTEDAA